MSMLLAAHLLYFFQFECMGLCVIVLESCTVHGGLVPMAVCMNID